MPVCGMACIKHSSHIPSIQIVNFQSDDTVDHSIVLLKGIISRCDNSDVPEHSQITVSTGNSTENCSIARNGEFKALVPLAAGSNAINVHYCCASHSITINLQRKSLPAHLVKVFYIICHDHDGRFQAPAAQAATVSLACQKINLAMALVQCLYAEMLSKAGFPRKTFQFVDCAPFASKLSVNDARQWSANQLWQFHAKEVLCAETDTSAAYKYVGVLACTWCSSGEIKGNAALGIGDFALIGGGTLFAWPESVRRVGECFENVDRVDGHRLCDDSNGRGTFGGCFSTALGTMCHEIGHIFDLGHTADGIMGSDIDYVHRVFINERFPWNLPKRSTSKPSAISDARPAKPTIAMPRPTSVRTTNTFLSTYRQRNVSDLTFFTENCATLLSHHKWFNQCAGRDFSIGYAANERLIHSRWPLVLVEMREQGTGMCRDYRRLDGPDKCTEYRISAEFVGRHCEVIAVDEFGNVARIAIE